MLERLMIPRGPVRKVADELITPVPISEATEELMIPQIPIRATEIPKATESPPNSAFKPGNNN